jgi:hypothetical protein
MILSLKHFENFENPTKTRNSIVLDSLNWIKPIINECRKKQHHATLINVELDKMHENSPVKCYGLGTSNLDDIFQKKNTRTILTGNKSVIALLWSQKDGKGRLVGMIPNPTGTRTVFQKTNMGAKSIVVKKRTEISVDDLDKLEFVLPPRRWHCVKNGTKYFPKVATEVYGDVNEDKRPVKCTKMGRPYFSDEKAKFILNKPPPSKPSPKQLEKQKMQADLQELKLNNVTK